MRALAIAAVPLLAGCCECALYERQPFVSPQGWVEAPTNVVAVREQGAWWNDGTDTAAGDTAEEGPPAFRSEAGDVVVPAVVTPVRIGTDDWYELWEPIEPLAPDTKWIGPVAFTTGSGPDDTAPPPVVVSVANHGGDRCGPWIELGLDSTDLDMAYAEVEISESEDMGEPLRWFGHRSRWGGCWPAREYPWDRRTDLFLRSRAVDLAGNTSDWSEPFHYRAPACATGSQGSALGGWLALLLLRRRR